MKATTCGRRKYGLRAPQLHDDLLLAGAVFQIWIPQYVASPSPALWVIWYKYCRLAMFQHGLAELDGTNGGCGAPLMTSGAEKSSFLRILVV